MDKSLELYEKKLRAGFDAQRDLMLMGNTVIGKVYEQAKKYDTVDEINQYLITFNENYTIDSIKNALKDAILPQINKIIDDPEISEEVTGQFRVIKNVILNSEVFKKQSNPRDYVYALAEGLAIKMGIQQSSERFLEENDMLDKDMDS